MQRYQWQNVRVVDSFDSKRCDFPTPATSHQMMVPLSTRQGSAGSARCDKFGTGIMYICPSLVRDRLASDIFWVPSQLLQEAIYGPCRFFVPVEDVDSGDRSKELVACTLIRSNLTAKFITNLSLICKDQPTNIATKNGSLLSSASSSVPPLHFSITYVR